jgi:putative protease
LIEEKNRPGELMPIMEDDHGTYIMNSKDLRAVQHVERLVKIGVDSLKIEGRTKSRYYVARTSQVYRKAIDAAVADQPFDLNLLSELEGLASRGYTDGFYQRHSTAEHQNYLRGYSESSRQQYVGDVVGYTNGIAEIAVKNRFAVGDRLEFIHPDGNNDLLVERLLNVEGASVEAAAGSGHIVRLPVSANVQNALVARYI